MLDNGGSSALTGAGKKAVRDFRGMEKKLAEYAEELMREHPGAFRAARPGGSARETVRER